MNVESSTEEKETKMKNAHNQIHRLQNQFRNNIQIKTHVLFLVLILINFPGVQSLELVLMNHEVRKGEILEIPISVDDPSSISGVALTIKFDTSVIDMEVESQFFGEIADNVQSENINPFVTLGDDSMWIQPYRVRHLPGLGIAFSGVRLGTISSDISTPVMVLKLQFKETAPAGLYKLELIPSKNGDQTFKPVVGHKTDGGLHPVLISSDRLQQKLLQSEVTLLPVILVDSDKDRIPDAWEIKWFDYIEEVTPFSNHDDDKLTDMMEYVLGTNPTIAETKLVFKPQVDASGFSVVFPLRDDLDIPIIMQWSESVHDGWTTEGIQLNKRIDLPSGDGWSTYEARIEEPEAATGFFSLDIQ